jgi:hypothetical protein
MATTSTQPILMQDASDEEAVRVLEQVVAWAGHRANNCDTPWGVYGYTHLYRTALDAIGGLTSPTEASLRELA